MVLPPTSLAELQARAADLAGRRLADIAEQYQLEFPPDLRRDKGWLGQCLEYVLGATAQSKAMPDFPELGVELKTMPINEQGIPQESTFVCVARLTQLNGLSWQDSLVYKKLKQVLWIPIIEQPDQTLLARQIATPFLWSPTLREQQILADDWQQLTDLIALGRVDEITARMGKALQIRPKAANARALCQAIGPEGEIILTLPRGFYLRSSFTRHLLAESFMI